MEHESLSMPKRGRIERARPRLNSIIVDTRGGRVYCTVNLRCPQVERALRDCARSARDFKSSSGACYFSTSRLTQGSPEVRSVYNVMQFQRSTPRPLS